MAVSTTTTRAVTAEAPLILSIDIGTSSTRVMLYDRRGRALEGIGSQERYQVRRTTDGAAEDDPEAALERMARCVDVALSQAGPLANRIGAVAVDTLVSNILALDREGKPITPVIIYADTRDDADADALRGALDERAVQDRTGCMLRSSYWPARLAWFRRVQPKIWRRAARWITLGEYMEMRLFGRCRVSFSAASWSGLLDRRTLTWDRLLLDYLGVKEDQLSSPVDVDSPLTGLLASYAERWHSLRDIPWFPAVGDGAAANVGSGCTDDTRIALTLGTSGAMRVVLPKVAHVPPGLWCYRVDRERALLGGATSEGGNVYAWMQRTLRLGSQAEVEEALALAAARPDGHGLTILPFFAGERSPDWAGNVQATIHGATLATTPLEILQASLEAVAYRFAIIEQRIFQEMIDRPGSEHCLVASGGGLLHSPVWMQIFADVLGRTVVASAEPEATSRGSAVLALRGIGAVQSIEAVPAADGVVYQPDPERHRVYQAAIERQRLLYESLIDPDS